MKTNNAFVVFLLSSIFFIYSEAVEVYKIGTNGKPSWRETSEMRDRSTVPRPSPEDVASYRRRSKIPVPVVTNYRSRSSDIPRPSRKDVLADYRRRSKIPISPMISKFRKRFKVPVSQVERTNVKTQSRRATTRHFPLQRKNIIDRIFFTIPFGAQFPIYFASKSKKGASKKSNVVTPVPILAQRNRVPFKLQTWGLPINYQALNNKRYLTPYVENQAIAKQQIIPTGDNRMSLAYNRGYNRPQSSLLTSRLLSNRNVVPYLSYRNQANIVPQQLQTFLRGRVRRDSGLKKSKPCKNKVVDPSRKAVITKEYS